MRLSVRLTIVFGLLGLVVSSSMAVVSWWLAAGEVRDSIDNELLSWAARVEEFRGGNFAPPEGPSPPSDEFDGFPDFRGGESGVQLFTASGSPIGDTIVGLSATALTELEPGAEPLVETIDTDDGRFRVATLAVDPSDGRFPVATLAVDPSDETQRVGYLQFFREISDEEGALVNLGLRLVVVAAASISLVGCGSWFVGRWLARPLGQLTSAATRLAELDAPPGRIEIARRDEIGRLAVSFNQMLSALEVGREQQRRLVADASHELRTPLTSLRMRTEFLASNDNLLPEERRRHQQAAVTDVEQLSALVNDLIDLAADVRAGHEKPRMARVGDVVIEVTDRFRVVTGRTVTVEVDDTETRIRPGMVRRAVQNLIDNANKYSPPETPITVRSRQGRIEVSDQGDGIAAEDLDHVFDRFYRSSKARTRPGNGIGLAIVAQVAEAHQGTTWARSDPSGGATVGFSVSLY